LRALIAQIENPMGQARVPGTLKRAGWEVATLSPKGSYMSATRWADRRLYFTLMREAEIVRDAAQAIDSFAPDIVLPADDQALYLLASIGALAGEDALAAPPKVTETLARSLPNKGAWAVVQRPSLLTAYAREIGIPAPAQRSLATFGDADVFATEHGYPIAIRAEVPFQDEVVTVCYGEDELLAALHRLLPPAAGQRLYMQQWVTGQTTVYEAAVVHGQVIAGRCMEFVELVPGTHDVPSVVRICDSPEIGRTCRRLAKATGANGFFSVRYKVDPATGEAWFTGTRFRLDDTSYLGIEAGVDLGKALLDGLAGNRTAEPRARIGHLQALYPHEAMRDPKSMYLRPTGDVPTDDPELMEAFQALLVDMATKVEQRI
jgi:hypothetical protein